MKKNDLVTLYKTKEYDHYLAEIFLYVLGRNNKKNSKSIIQRPKRLLYKSSILSDDGAIEQIYKTFNRITKIDDICVSGKYVLEGPFSFDSFYDNDGARSIRVKTIFCGLVICGDTSLDNWISRSYVNNVTKVKTTISFPLMSSSWISTTTTLMIRQSTSLKARWTSSSRTLTTAWYQAAITCSKKEVTLRRQGIT